MYDEWTTSLGWYQDLDNPTRDSFLYIDGYSSFEIYSGPSEYGWGLRRKT